MPTIAHISDIHYERRDADTLTALSESLSRLRPDYLVASGDFADNPWRISESRRWLDELCKACGIGGGRLIVVPGNHDSRVWGNFGFRWLTQYWFRKHFPEWKGPQVRFESKDKLAMWLFDTNPIFWGLARGRVWPWQLRNLRRQHRAFSDDERAMMWKSARIAIMHHHPLPMPHKGSDFFLRSTQF